MADSKKDKYANGIAKFLIAAGCATMLPIACTDETKNSDADQGLFVAGCAATFSGLAILSMNSKEK